MIKKNDGLEGRVFDELELQLAGLKFVDSFGYNQNIFRESFDNGKRYVFERNKYDDSKVNLIYNYNVKK